MQYFRKIGLGLIATCALSGSIPAFAVGTDAGSSVVNSVSLEYTVAGGAPISETADATFVVDRKLALNVTATDTNYVSVGPGQAFAGQTGVPALTFTVTNNGNDDTSVLLGVVDQNGVGSSSFAGPPSGGGPYPFFDEDDLLLAIDVDGNGLYDSGIDTDLVAIGSNVYDLDAGLGSQLAEDDTTTILIVADIPGSAAADEIATYTLVASHYTGAQEPVAGDDNGNDAPGFTGATDVVDDPTSVQVVFADAGFNASEDLVFDFNASTGGTTTDVASNGQDSDTSAFIVLTTGVFLVKTSQTVWDPVSELQFYDAAGAVSGDNPKAIPGAVVMYVIALKNGELAGAAPADLSFLRDDIPTPELAPGNTGSAVINLPTSLTIDVDPSTEVDNVVFTLPGSISDDEVTIVDCNNGIATQTFAADPNEIDVPSATLGSCEGQESAFILYFATINDAP